MATHHDSRGDRRRRAIAVGSAAAVAELAVAVGREPTAGYVMCGACVPDAEVFPPGVTVPRLGSVEHVTQGCDEVGADTVLVAADSGSSPMDLRRVASELDARDIELLVAHALTDELGAPTVRVREVAGLRLVEVAYARQPEPAGSWAGLVRPARPLAAPVLVAIPMVALVAIFIWVTDLR